MTSSPAQLDPVTFEVIRHRLLAITEEQRITFQSISGSPVVTEASDYFTGLFMADGTIITMGYKVATQGGPMTLSIRALQELFPGQIQPGDLFLINDPYRCAVHQNDIQVLAPLFYQGECVAWAGFGAHEVDVGGMDFASWCPGAKDVFQEGTRIPGVKIVDQGVIREDLWRFVLTLSRLPHFLDLDMRGMVAAAHVSQLRLEELLGKYGLPAVHGAMARMIAISEEKLRARLRAMPDVIIRTEDWLEHDGHADRLYRVSLTLTKRGESIDLDFTGSSDQAPGFVNCTRAGIRGGVVGALFPALGFDIPWNEGLLRPVTIRTREGSICDSRYPAPVGAATVEAVWIVKNALAAALSRLKACTPGLSEEVQAVSDGTMPTVNLGGTDQYGQRYGIHLMDPLMGGFGAYYDQDGYDVGGSYSTAVPNVANVESNELLSPMLYLHRRLVPDTAGAGMWRGGVAAGMAFTPHAVPSTDALIMTHGLEVPNSTGLFGGYPGSCVSQRLMRGSDLAAQQAGGAAPTGIDQLSGELTELGPKPGLIELRPGDIFETLWQGGGGMGDPLDREPGAVLADFRAGLATREGAARLYGVVLSPAGKVDAAGTTQLREGMRRERISRSTPPPEPARGRVQQLEHHLGGRLHFARHKGAAWFACACGQPLAPRHGDWRSGAMRRVTEPAVLGLHLTLHPQLELRQFACPGCGGSLAVDVAEKGAQDLRDIELLPAQ